MTEPGHSAAPTARQQIPDSDPTPDPDRAFPLRAPPSPVRRTIFIFIAFLIFAGFLALTWWQLERRVWKLDLIARVEQRVHAAPVAPPGRERWPQITAASDEYRRVEVKGRYLYDRQTLVQASTDLGSGFWVMTPFRMGDGDIVLIDRGFVAPQAVDAIRAAARAAALSNESEAVAVTGLLRMSQPGGGFLRHNDAAADRWYSRDVQAIAIARGLHGVAPYFIDADAAAAPAAATDPADPAYAANAADATRAPVGGLTLIAFPNNHLVYALTWLALALMTAGAAWRTLRTWHTWPAWHPRREPPILPAEQKRGERKDGSDVDPGNVQ